MGVNKSIVNVNNMIVPSMNHLRAAMWILGGGVVLLFSLYPGGLQLIGGWFVIGGVVWDALEIAQHPSCCKTLILLQKHFIVENCVQSCTYLATQLKQLDNTTILATHLSGRVLALNFSSSPRNHPPSLLALPKHSCVQNWEHNLVQPCTTLHTSQPHNNLTIQLLLQLIYPGKFKSWTFSHLLQIIFHPILASRHYIESTHHCMISSQIREYTLTWCILCHLFHHLQLCCRPSTWCETVGWRLLLGVRW